MDGHGAPARQQAEEAVRDAALVVVARGLEVHVGVAAADHLPVQRGHFQQLVQDRQLLGRRE
eukprot:3554605-Lingulodinium_polyedra.AAC.1